MKDFLGNELKVGDNVVFIASANDSPRLETGTVDKIYANDKECTVTGRSHVYSSRLMKLDK